MKNRIYISSTELASRCGVPIHTLLKKLGESEMSADGNLHRGVGFTPLFDESRVDEICQQLFGRPPRFTRLETLPNVH